MTKKLPECEQFPGRLNEICNGTALIDGKPMNPEHVTIWRAQFGLPPIGVAKEEWYADLISRGLANAIGEFAHWNDLAHPQVDLPNTTKIAHPRSELPPLLIRGWNFAVAITRWTVAGMPRLSEPEIDARLTICQSCEFLHNNRCSKCGCACNSQDKLINKLALATENCPIGKWTAKTVPSAVSVRHGNEIFDRS